MDVTESFKILALPRRGGLRMLRLCHEDENAALETQNIVISFKIECFA